MIITIPWIGFGIDLSLRIDHLSAFIAVAANIFGLLVALYCVPFLKGKRYAGQFYAYLFLSLIFINGAVLANNLIAMLFFWEGLLVTMFAMIFIGSKDAFRTAIKAFIIVGISDLCMMLGIILTGNLAHTFTMSSINLPLDGLGSAAYILLMIGAIAKGGSMPFHSWIPDAAIDAPLPFMAFMPAAIEKLMGIYFLARISLEMFQLTTSSWISPLLMTIGALTILLAVMMALIQKDFKKLLSYHAISQVGYMILGIGTAVPAGIIGGLFHMINNAMYKSCLFLTGGAVEKQTGTTDLNRLGGIAAKMPVTFICFIITAVSISGVPPFNGFFSKELVYDGALERGLIFYLAAVIGSFFTAASFLKLGHAAFIDKPREEHKDVKEVPFAMQLPMILIALGCVIFGVYNSLPIGLIQPMLGGHSLEGRSFAGFPSNMVLVVITLIVLAAALLNHLFGVRAKGSGLKAVDHIHYAPVLSGIYDRAEKKVFDPYNIGIYFITWFSKALNWIDKAVDWIYETLTVKIAYFLTYYIRKAHTGNYAVYMAWSLAGLLVVIIYLVI
jgi:NADH-quinone oxidoreductase subunit L